jgi:uncharacterized membrane protein
VSWLLYAFFGAAALRVAHLALSVLLTERRLRAQQRVEERTRTASEAGRALPEKHDERIRVRVVR